MNKNKFRKKLNSFFNNYLSNSSIIKTNNISKNKTNITIENSKLSLLKEKEIKNRFLNHLIYNCQDIKKAKKIILKKILWILKNKTFDDS